MDKKFYQQDLRKQTNKPNRAYNPDYLFKPPNFLYSNTKKVATNQKVNKTFETIIYSLFPVSCLLKSSRICVANTPRIAI